MSPASLIRNDGVVLRPIHGSFFLIDIADNYSGDKCALYEINEIGAFLWRNIDGKNSLEDLVSLLQSAIEDDVPASILRQDTNEYLIDLKAHGFISEVI
ncbi:MAG: PqqD family protein [Olsenella sp.]|nr:PqqD family protein [Olsenella sp.]